MTKPEIEKLKNWYASYNLSAEESENCLATAGGFSIEVAIYPEFFKYVKGKHASGYYGSSMRTNKRDRIIEAAMRKLGMGPGAIACWLTSTKARHLMDEVEINWTAQQFAQHIDKYLVNAPLNVFIWSHPDHKGSMASTIDLTNLLKQICKEHFKKEDEDSFKKHTCSNLCIP